MTNKFISFLEAVGHDFKKGLDYILPYAETAGEAAVTIFAPALGPLFNQTVSAVVTAEQSAAAIKAGLTGPQKLSAVATLVGPLIQQALTDAGKTADEAAVQSYINAIVLILNTVPASPAPAPTAS
jgi:hypothetical protein